MKRPIPETMALLMLSAVDVILTHHVLQNGGMELNPVGNWLIGMHGFWGMVLIKLPLVAILTWALYRWDRYQESKQQKYTKVLRWVTYFMSFIAGWNGFQLLIQHMGW